MMASAPRVLVVDRKNAVVEGGAVADPTFLVVSVTETVVPPSVAAGAVSVAMERSKPISMKWLSVLLFSSASVMASSASARATTWYVPAGVAAGMMTEKYGPVLMPPEARAGTVRLARTRSPGPGTGPRERK